MPFEFVYTIQQIPSKRDQVFSLTTLNSNTKVYIFDYIDNREFCLYQNDHKIIKYKSIRETRSYSFKFNNTDELYNFMFYPKMGSRRGYKIIRKRSHESNEVNWSWNYSKDTLGYTLINKNAQNIEIARISGFSLDGQSTGMICIADSIPEDYQTVIIFTACIIWNKNLLTSWNKFRSLLNYKK